jgi:hypothetical protein
MGFIKIDEFITRSIIAKIKLLILEMVVFNDNYLTKYLVSYFDIRTIIYLSQILHILIPFIKSYTINMIFILR